MVQKGNKKKISRLNLSDFEIKKKQKKKKTKFIKIYAHLYVYAQHEFNYNMIIGFSSSLIKIISFF